MSHLTIRPGRSLRGQPAVPGDKSISHRALLLGALASGTSRISGFLPSEDCRATLHCLRALGIGIEETNATTLLVQGRGLWGFSAPAEPLNCGGSGTTMRLLSGILAGQSMTAVLSGNTQLSRRPMARIVDPLRLMGAKVADTEGHAPLIFEGGGLRGLDYTLPMASAQVKSALLLAGLYATGSTTVREPAPSRDHTERMLRAMGCQVQVVAAADDGEPQEGVANSITVLPCQPSSLPEIVVPGDVSSAAFLLSAAVLLAGSDISLVGVGVNPTRSGALDVLRAMGARIRMDHRRENGGEPAADLSVQAAGLRATEIGGDLIPRLIDELPLLALVATQAQGVTLIRDAAELRVKETDRIDGTVAELRKMGAEIDARPDGFVIRGPTPLAGATVHSHGDHRLAMTLAVAGLLASGETRVLDADCISDSFPGFAPTLRQLGAEVR